MKSGLEDRNNAACADCFFRGRKRVSMKSGLEDRNNEQRAKGFAIAEWWSQ